MRMDPILPPNTSRKGLMFAIDPLQHCTAVDLAMENRGMRDMQIG